MEKITHGPVDVKRDPFVVIKLLEVFHESVVHLIICVVTNSTCIHFGTIIIAIFMIIAPPVEGKLPYAWIAF